MEKLFEPHIKIIHGMSENEALLKVVCDILRQDTHLKTSSNLEVEVRGAEVYLTGEVPYHEDKYRVEKIVRKIRGVVNVTNHLKVSSDRLNTPYAKTSQLHERLRDVRVGTLRFTIER